MYFNNPCGMHLVLERFGSFFACVQCLATFLILATSDHRKDKFTWHKVGAQKETCCWDVKLGQSPLCVSLGSILQGH